MDEDFYSYMGYGFSILKQQYYMSLRDEFTQRCIDFEIGNPESTADSRERWYILRGIMSDVYAGVFVSENCQSQEEFSVSRKASACALQRLCREEIKEEEIEKETVMFFMCEGLSNKDH